jgi:quinol monooxygenase YgiN
MVSMSAVVTVSPGKAKEFLQAIDSLLGDPEREEGLVTSILYREIDGPNGFRLICEWETQEDRERYFMAERFQVLLGAFEVLCENYRLDTGASVTTGLAMPVLPVDPRTGRPSNNLTLKHPISPSRRGERDNYDHCCEGKAREAKRVLADYLLLDGRRGETSRPKSIRVARGNRSREHLQSNLWTGKTGMPRRLF